MAVEARTEPEKLRAEFGDAILSTLDKLGETYICVRRERIADVVRFLRDDRDLKYDYFVECDW